MELFFVSVSIALITLSAVAITVFVMLNRSIREASQLLGDIRRDMSPIVGDLATISQNLAAASESVKNGLQRASQLTDALGNIGDDLEEGRQAVKGTLESASQWVAPWLGLLKWFRKK